MLNRYVFIILLMVAVSCSDDSSEVSQEMDINDPIEQEGFTDSFDGSGELSDFITNNATALPDVSQVNGRYLANLTDNSDNITLHFNQDQGRLDAKLLEFPFEFIARNIGVGVQGDSQTAPPHSNDPYNFAGVQVHVLDLDDPSSSHVVVGHRGPTGFTIEGKNTVNGSSSVNDIGANTVPEGRADIRIVGLENQTILVYWQLPNLDTTQSDNWILYNETGNLPGDPPEFGNSVYVGLITYAFGYTGVPFVGTCDQIEIVID